MNALHIDATNCLRIDSFSVPDAARAEFEGAMQRNMRFIAEQPGFRGHLVFHKSAGPTSMNIVTIAVWESRAAIEAATEKVRAYYASIGFDPGATLARFGVRAELGNFVVAGAPAEE
jgi:antibiotic biosynthesis monooxygenase